MDVKLVAIMALFELICLHIIYSCVYNYSNVKNVVDAFGFGGTLVGILVGVIAIIYAFYQGAAQQQTNNTMVAELTKLASIKEEIANSSLTLKDQLQGLSDFAKSLESIDANVVSTRSVIIKEVGEMLSRQEGKKAESSQNVISPTTAEVRSHIEFIKVFISRRSDALVYIDAFILKEERSGQNYSAYAKELLDKIKKANSKYDFLTYDFFMYSLAQILIVYQAAGILQPTFNEGKVEWIFNKDEENNRLEIIKFIRQHMDKENRAVLEKILIS
jgi:hypothetical protein